MRWAERERKRVSLRQKKEKAVWVVSGEKERERERDHLFSLRSIPESTTGPVCSRAERNDK